MYTTDTIATSEQFLDLLGRELGLSRSIRFEFSIRLSARGVEDRGRFCCWLAGNEPADSARLVRLLDRLAAPDAVLRALHDCTNPLNRGIAVSFAENGPEFRLYLHALRPHTLAEEYHGWRFRPGEPPRCSTYSFHYLPETADGRRPLDLIDRNIHAAAAEMLQDRRLNQGSGFWLRQSPEGRVEQVDLIFPWAPPAVSVPGLMKLASQLEVPVEQEWKWRDLPLRHVAFTVGASSPSITLYSSGARNACWPSNETVLQELVKTGARASQRYAEEKLYCNLPALPAAPEPLVEARLGRFYDGEIATWKSVLGDSMHYHHGIFEDPNLDKSDVEMEAALRRSVTELFRFIPRGGRVYDVGCGWGGPLAMWTAEHDCPSLGITISRQQFRYVAGLGLPVRWGDAERTLPPGHFDCTILLESFCHIHDKARLLEVLRRFSRRLIMRVNCQDAAPEGSAFGGTMQMIRSCRLREIVESAGWRIREWRDRRVVTLPTVAVWNRRIQSIAPSRDEHLEVFRGWCSHVTAAALSARMGPYPQTL